MRCHTSSLELGGTLQTRTLGGGGTPGGQAWDPVPWARAILGAYGPFCLPGLRWEPAFHGTHDQAVAEAFREAGVVLEGEVEPLLLLVDNFYRLPGFPA